MRVRTLFSGWELDNGRQAVTGSLRILSNAVVFCCFAFLPGCALLDMNKEIKTVESAVTISGSVENHSGVSGQMYYQFYRRVDDHLEAHAQFPVAEDGIFTVRVRAGDVMVVAYVDADGDQNHDEREPAAFLLSEDTQSRTLTLEAGEVRERQRIVIEAAPAVLHQKVVEGSTRFHHNLGKVIDINDPMISADNARVGLWHPLKFVTEIGGGLMMLQDYDPEKVPVLYVHGINGSPKDFSAAIQALDTTRYQPWVFYYPSGMRLDIVSDYLVGALDMLYVDFSFNDMVVISHSMGGLMSRSFLMKYAEGSRGYTISRHVTINSPLLGMDSANAGVNYSPVVVPSWRDVASGSEYVEKVNAWTMPDNIEYHLVFSFLDGEVGDGVVPVSSQLSRSLQEEAHRIHGFNAQHAGVLGDDDFLATLNQILQ